MTCPECKKVPCFMCQTCKCKSTWISISEKLPEEGQEVLLNSNIQTYSLATFVGGKFYPFSGDSYSKIDFKIMHWRELPLPPCE